MSRWLKLSVYMPSPDVIERRSVEYVWISESGQEWVRCSRLDGIGLSALRRLGIALDETVSFRQPGIELANQPDIELRHGNSRGCYPEVVIGSLDYDFLERHDSGKYIVYVAVDVLEFNVGHR